MSNIAGKFEKVSYEAFEECARIQGLTKDNAMYHSLDLLRKGYDDIKLPRRATVGSAGYDFFAPYEIDLKPGESWIIPTCIRCKMNPGWVLKIYPRSGLGFKYKLQLMNTVGIIDEDYYNSDNEGHIMIKIYNDSPDGQEIIIPRGEAFAQGIFLQYGITENDTANGIRNGGFGSTSK